MIVYRPDTISTILQIPMPQEKLESEDSSLNDVHLTSRSSFGDWNQIDVLEHLAVIA